MIITLEWIGDNKAVVVRARLDSGYQLVMWLYINFLLVEIVTISNLNVTSITESDIDKTWAIQMLNNLFCQFTNLHRISANYFSSANDND